jgi:pimeloyl-[acyl-carrier protein] synthase
MSTAVPVFNPFSPAFQADPYPIYQQLRQIDPVHRVKGFRFDQWFLTRYADVYEVLNDSRVTVDDLPVRLAEKGLHLRQTEAMKSESSEPFQTLTQTIGHWLFFVEPPDHTRLRSLVSKTFAATRIEQLRPLIQQQVDQLLDRVQPQGQMDIMLDLAAPLPAAVSAAILGVPECDRPQLTQWSYDLFHVFDQPLSLQDYQRIDQIAAKFQQYFTELVQTLRQHPQDNLICKLIEASQEQKLTDAELIAFLSMLFSVGQETTENLIGNGILALLQHPECWQMIQENLQRSEVDTLIAKVIEELLRFDSPVQIISRTATASVALREHEIQVGDKVHLLLGAANRDPAQFTDPDRLDFGRSPTSRLPFGSGIHYCLGAELARLQGQIVVRAIATRFPKLQLITDGLTRRKSVVLRGLKHLPVTF